MNAPATPPAKTCVTCGRSFEWRRKWARDWPQVKHCSQRCRRRKLDDTDRALESKLLEIAARRGRNKTLCPSEAPRALAPDNDEWRPLMPRTLDAARRLIDQGRLEMLQKGRVVDPSRTRGPVRLRRRG